MSIMKTITFLTIISIFLFVLAFLGILHQRWIIFVTYFGSPILLFTLGIFVYKKGKKLSSNTKKQGGVILMALGIITFLLCFYGLAMALKWHD